MKKSLVVGMGIGKLYSDVLSQLEQEVFTVDLNPAQTVDFRNIQDAVEKFEKFDTAHICTPNYTHEQLARQVAPHSRIVFIEKPGLIDSAAWGKLIADFPNTRFMMVKNNMWRDNILTMRGLVPHSESIKFKWINKNRIPQPGGWFTNKELAFGGVSRDLMPHLLSLYAATNQHWQDTFITGYETKQLHKLEDIESTEYGQVNPEGVYDVDDVCKIKFNRNGRTWKLEANWADGQADDRCIEFKLHDGTIERFELGLCPESAYHAMIRDALEQVDNDDWWLDQLNIDLWIHTILEKLRCE